MLRHLGLVSFLLLIAGLSFTVLRWRGGLHMTFSQHAAMNRVSMLYYSSLFLVTLPLLLLYIAGWFAPRFELGPWFIGIAGVSILTQIVCTFFPEVGGWKTSVHRIITGISGVLLLPLVSMVALSIQISLPGRIVAVFSLVSMTVLLVIALKNQAGYRYALLLQIGYYAFFFATLLTATYL